MTDDTLAHYGTKRHSGRYPWGSGGNVPSTTEVSDFVNMVKALRKENVSDSEIAAGYGINRQTLQARMAQIKAEEKAQKIHTVRMLKEKGMSNQAISERTSIPESTIRTMLKPQADAKREDMATLTGMLKARVDSTDQFIDVGKGVSNWLGITETKLNQALALLQDEGYTITKVQVPTGIENQKTTVKVLAKPGTIYRDVVSNLDNIGTIGLYGDNGQIKTVKPPVSIDSKRVAVRWAEDGGTEADGVIYVRRGVPDVSLGEARYAQVRIAVDGTHYIKGMAVYSDNMPNGKDLYFNTNKSRPADGDIHKALKDLKADPIFPFGSQVRQREYTDKDGTTKQSVLNVVGSTPGSGEEGYWSTWSKTLSSQMLSKQKPELAKQQLGVAYDKKKSEFDEIMSLTNPLVKQKLLEEFAGSVDSASVHLKAAGLPRTANHVILPIASMKENEVYAPGYRDGEKVVLIRHPHGGKFEIPELTVNNKNPEARRTIGSDAPDAIGIHHRVAEQLSGADFDGDSVLVIPNPGSGPNRIQVSKPLAALKDFDPKREYKLPEGQTFKGDKQRLMGDVSNLITDMSIKQASVDEIARAVKHSMVVIDAEKHNLNYKQSEQDFGIKALKEKYQGSTRGGASTIVSRASSDARVPERKERRMSEGGPVDPKTGEKVYTYTNATYIKRRTNKDGTVTEKELPRLIKSTKMAETKDAFSLVSRDHNGQTTVMESVYAEHANKLKALANAARKESISVKLTPTSSKAKAAYASEVASLNAKLNTALKNAPLERKAQLIANTTVSARKKDNPDMDADELKKVRNMALNDARARTGAGKTQIHITDREWEAIQAGAVSNSRLSEILRNADTERVKTLATPRKATVMTPAVLARAQAMAARGATPAEIADALGVAPSTITSALGRS